MRALPFRFVLVVLLAPVALAHIAHERPPVQETQADRNVLPNVDGVNATFEFFHSRDAVSDYVRHVVDPKRGVVSVEYRPQASATDDAFGARWVVTRVIEYRDQNQDGVYTPVTDTVVRSWRLQGYTWNVTAPQLVRVGAVQGQYVRWNGNLTGGPGIQLEVVGAGKEFVDEGATVRSQDLIVYLHVAGFPERGSGNLHAIEGEAVPLGPGAFRLLNEGEDTVALLLEAADRLALFDWGGEALVDGVEGRVQGELDAPTPNGAVAFRLSLPRADEEARFVLVSGVEYKEVDRRASGGGAVAILLVGAALVALLRRN